MAAKVCLLSKNEAFQLEMHDVEPNCRNHSHRSKEYADGIAKSGTAYFINKPGRRRMAFLQARSWMKAQSGCVAVMQFTSETAQLLRPGKSLKPTSNGWPKRMNLAAERA